MDFYRTKHDPEMDNFLSDASLSHHPPPENLTILEGKNYNQHICKVAQRGIEMVNLPWLLYRLVELWVSFQEMGDVWVMEYWLTLGRV